MKNFFKCPSCGNTALLYGKTTVKCRECSSLYEYQEGIYLLKKNEAKFYWGVEQVKMEKMLDSAREVGWENAMHGFISSLSEKDAKLIWARTFDPRRSALQGLINLKKSDKVLEIGPGWGAIALHIAPNCRQYVAMDQIRVHLEWIRETMQHFDQDNVDLVCSGNDNFLPFMDNYFDKVIMNGVLEWVASNTPGDPRQVQQRFLRQIAGILKPDGQLYVGIENRINWKYFLGVPEGHLGMKYGALLPRFATRFYLKKRRDQAFREYTYTVWGYKKLLRQAGFNFKRFYSTLPMYSNIRRIYPIKMSRKSYLKKILPWQKFESNELFARFPTILFSHCLGFTSAKNEFSEQSLVENILCRVTQQLGIGKPVLHNALCKISNTGKSTLLFEYENKKYWLSIGLNRFARASIVQNKKAGAFLKAHLSEEKHRAYLPKVLLQGKVENYPYLVEEYREGAMADTILKNNLHFENFNQEVLEFLDVLAGNAKSVCLEGEIYTRLVAAPLSNLRKWFSEDEFKQFAGWFENTQEWLEENLYGEFVPLTPRHGDLVPTNCIIQDGQLSAIIDWELFEPEALPLSDFIIFTGNAFRPRVREELRAQEIDPDTVAFHGYPEMFLEGQFRKWTERFMAKLEMKLSLLKPLLFMWWITHLNDMQSFHRFNPTWKTLRVRDVIERWKKVENFTAERINVY